jgi:predicted ATPase
MLATIRNRVSFRIATLALLATLGLSLSSCATKKDTALITDPNDKKETALPWNEQQKWEREGEAAAMNQQRRY